MVTEAQKKVFKENIDEVFEIVKNAQENGELNITSQLRKWFSDQYVRYRNYKNNVNPRHILPYDHVITLETKLSEENLTLDEFEKTQGKIEILVETFKSKTNSKEMSLEDIIKLRNETEEECRKLEKKLNKRKLYRLTDEECNEYTKKIEEHKETLKNLNKQIEEATPKEEEKKEEKHSETACKKIEELLSQNKKKDNEIASLKDEIKKYREERTRLNSKYREDYEKQLQIYSKELDEKFNAKLKEETDKQVKKANAKIEENRQMQKKHIRNLLFTQDIVSVEDIKFKLKTLGIPSTKFDIALNDLKNEIPGIVKVIDSEGKMHSYSINANSVGRFNTLKHSNACPRISNVYEGTVQFVAIADLHADLKSSEDDLRRRLEPIHEFCTENKNIPIISLGDNADTLKDIDYDRWKQKDKEAMKLSYEFYKNYAKAISEADNISHYELFGNHEEHPYIVGIDPLEILNAYCNNITFLGAEQGSFMIGNDQIGVFHRKFKEIHGSIFSSVGHEITSIAKDYIYSLIAHYHKGAHIPLQRLSFVDNKIPLLFTAEVEDGTVKRMFVRALRLINKDNKPKLACDVYQTEIYNSEYRCKKKSY
ncbi:MAG: hypothetical protein IK137_00280 [Bacilli bacterium]|nr:hypothetical protein [Bacilli bacterium]